MADRVRIVEFTDRRKRPVTVLDLNDLSTRFNTREGGFSYTPPAKTPLMATDNRRFGGERQVGEGHANGQVTFTTGTKGASGDACLANLEAALAVLNAAATVGRYIEWRAEGATYSSYFAIMATAAWNPNYRIRQFVGSLMVDTQVSIQTAPLVEWDAMDILDDFAVDSLADYTVDTGAGTIAVAGGQLVPSTLVEKRLYHTVRGYPVLDAQVTFKYTTGAVSTIRPGIMLRRQTASDWIGGEITGGNTLRMMKQTTAGGVVLVGASVAITALTVNTTYWLRVRIEGQVLVAEHWTTDPALGGTPATTTATYTLSGAEQALYLAGPAGFRVVPADLGERYDDLRIEPFTKTARNLPELVDFPDAIPGTAPAVVDIHLGTTAGQQPVFAAFGWGRRPTAFNMVWNGDFEDSAMGTAGWGTASPVSSAPTSVARSTAAAKFGAACLVITVPASAFRGASFHLYRRFRKGVSYTITGWVRSPTLTDTFRAYLTNAAASSFGSVDVVLSAAWQQFTTTWTPAADVDEAYVDLTHVSGTAGDLQVDGVIVYETALGAPAGKQGEGRGAVPPFGVIEAEAVDTSTLVNAAVVANGATRGGYNLQGSAAGAIHAEWLVDPSLIATDEFRQGEVDIEVWARNAFIAGMVSPRAVLSVLPDEGASYGAQRYTNEWGAAGRPIIAATASSWRTTRLGTITLPVDLANPRRYRLALDLTFGAGSTGIGQVDQLILLPARARAASPSGKANDATYPKLAPSSGETRRVFRADGRGLIGKPAGVLGPYAGLDGARCMPDPGTFNLVGLLGSTVPDDPTTDASADAQTMTAALIHAGIVPRSFMARGA